MGVRKVSKRGVEGDWMSGGYPWDVKMVFGVFRCIKAEQVKADLESV